MPSRIAASLNAREADVEAEARTGRGRARGVPLDHLVLAEEAGRRRRVGRRRPSPASVAEPLVDHQQREVGERVAERGHLPVEHRGDPVVARRRARCRAGSRRARRPVARLERARAAAAARAARRSPAGRGCARRPAACPSGCSCRARKPSGRPKSAEADGRGVDRRAGRPACRRGARDASGCARRRAARAPRPCGTAYPVDELHHVERRADHRVVLAQRVRRGHRHRGVAAARVITRYSRLMSCAVASTCPSGGRRTTHVLLAVGDARRSGWTCRRRSGLLSRSPAPEDSANQVPSRVQSMPAGRVRCPRHPAGRGHASPTYDHPADGDAVGEPLDAVGDARRARAAR